MLETPRRPHDYFSLESKEIEIRIPERARPIRIHYKTAGSGKPLVLIHGLMTDSYSFRYVITALARSYRVIVPDMPGAGSSDSPLDLSMSPPTLASVLAALIEALGHDRPYVVANSMGGYQAMWLALTKPESMRRLMVMHSPGFPEARLYALNWASALPGAEALYRWLATRDPENFVAKNVHYHRPDVMSREEAKHYAGIFRDPARTHVFWKILRETMSARVMADFVRKLTESGAALSATLPICLLWAREDVMVPPGHGPRYKALLPSSELVWLEETSHFLHVESPERVIEEILRFDRG